MAFSREGMHGVEYDRGTRWRGCQGLKSRSYALQVNVCVAGEFLTLSLHGSCGCFFSCSSEKAQVRDKVAG